MANPARARRRAAIPPRPPMVFKPTDRQAQGDARLAIEASDPACPAGRLRAIVGEWDTLRNGFNVRSDALWAVAAHPNTPPDLLLALLHDYADAFCANPAAPLLALEPDSLLLLLSEANRPALHALLRQESAPAPLVALLASGTHGLEDVAQAARLHVVYGGELLDETWLRAMREFWPWWLREAPTDERHEAAELVEVGLAPRSLFGRAAPPRAAALPDVPDTDPLVVCFEAQHLTRRGWPGGLRPLSPTSPLEIAERSAFETWAESRKQGAPGSARPAVLVLRALVKLLLGRAPAGLRRSVLQHPACSDRLLREGHAAALLASLRARCPTAGGEGEGVWWLGAPGLIFCLHPATSEEVHRGAMGSWHWLSRLIGVLSLRRRHVGGFGLSDTKALRLLTSDGNRLVRTAARARLRGEEFTWE